MKIQKQERHISIHLKILIKGKINLGLHNNIPPNKVTIVGQLVIGRERLENGRKC